MRIYIRVTPRSSVSAVEKISEGEYRAKLNSPPVGGAANKELITLLAAHFKTAKTLIKIVGGKSSRQKIVDILGC